MNGLEYVIHSFDHLKKETNWGSIVFASFSWTMWRWLPLKHWRGSAHTRRVAFLISQLATPNKICCVLPVSGDARGATCMRSRVVQQRRANWKIEERESLHRTLQAEGQAMQRQKKWVRLEAFSESEDDFCEKKWEQSIDLLKKQICYSMS